MRPPTHSSSRGSFLIQERIDSLQMSYDGIPSIREPTLSACTCASHAPVIIRPVFCQQLNDKIQQLLGISNCTRDPSGQPRSFGEKPSTFRFSSVNLQNECKSGSVADRAPTSSMALNQPPSSQKTYVESNFFTNNMSPSKSEQQQVNLSEIGAKDERIVAQPMQKELIAPVKAESQDDFAELWADFGALHTVIESNSSAQSFEISHESKLSSVLSRDFGFPPENHSECYENGVSYRPRALIKEGSITTICSTSKDNVSEIAANSDHDMVSSQTIVAHAPGSSMLDNVSAAPGKPIEGILEMIRTGEHFFDNDGDVDLKPVLADIGSFGNASRKENSILIGKHVAMDLNVDTLARPAAALSEGATSSGPRLLNIASIPSSKEPMPSMQDFSCFSVGFSTASGKKIEISKEMIQKSEELLNQESVTDVIPNINFDLAFSEISEIKSPSVSLTRGNNQAVSNYAAGASEQELPCKQKVPMTPPNNSGPGFLFCTGSGSSIAFTKEMVSKGAQILDDCTSSHEGTPSVHIAHSPGHRTELRATPLSPRAFENSSQADELKIGCSSTNEHKTFPIQQNHSQERRFCEDLTNSLKSPLVPPHPAASSQHRQVASTSKRFREKPSILANFKTPSPLTRVQNSLAVIRLQTPPSSHFARYRKRLKFTPPVSHLPSTPSSLSINSPSKPNYSTRESSSVSHRVGLKKFADIRSEIASVHVPSTDILELTSVSAASYVFPDGRNWNNVVQDLKDTNVNSCWASEEWVKNHYRWIVWKYASMERRFGLAFLKYDRVYKQILHRYEAEFILSKRSCIKFITEQDRAPGGFIVLCIASTNSSQKTIELTDGWYSIFAELDTCLKRSLFQGKLYEGLKLRLVHCTLAGGVSPCTPLENKSMRLRLFANCTRRARWHCRLGFQQQSGFLVSLGSLKPNGGMAPRLRLRVLRILPTQFTERVQMQCGKHSRASIRTAVRNQIGDNAASRMHEEQLLILEDILRESFADQSVEKLIARTHSTKSLSPEFIEKIASEVEAASFDKITDILKEKICPRPVAVIHRYLVKSAKEESSPDSRSYILSISHANSTQFHVGDIVMATHLDCSSGPFESLLFSSTPRTRFSLTSSSENIAGESSVFDFSSRNFSMGLFLDVAGFLVLQTPSSIVISSTQLERVELLLVQLGVDWISPKLSVGQFITVQNLFYNRFDARFCCHSTIGRGTALIAAERTDLPLPRHFEIQCHRAQAIVYPCNSPNIQFAQEVKLISNMLTGCIQLQENSSFEEYFSFDLCNTQVLARKELVRNLLADQADTSSINGRTVCAWIVAEVAGRCLHIAAEMLLL